MTRLDLDTALRVAIDAADAAGAILLEGHGIRDKTFSSKAHRNDPVTEYDRRAEAAIVGRIGEAFPGAGILGEESGRLGAPSDTEWIIDPLDGTNNFVRGVPHFAVSIALRSRGEIVVGCIHDPMRGETFTAIRGRGASVNGATMAASHQPALAGALVTVGFSYLPARRTRVLDRLPEIAPHARAIRCTGSAALDLAYVAGGRFDAAWYLSLHEWDVAAARLLIAEAGGTLTDLSGAPLDDPQRGLLASNGRFHGALVESLGGG